MPVFFATRSMAVSLPSCQARYSVVPAIAGELKMTHVKFQRIDRRAGLRVERMEEAVSDVAK